jgi:hypothetical protein
MGQIEPSIYSLSHYWYNWKLPHITGNLKTENDSN